MFALLKDKNFRLLWLGQLCSQFGDRLAQLVLVGVVATRSSGSPLNLAKVLVMTSLPALLVHPFAGAYVDRWNRKRTMIACDLIRAGVMVSLPWLVMSPSPLPLYLGVFLLFAVGSFFIPARLAMIPDLVASDQLAQANALFTTSGMVGSTLIVLVGALLVEWTGVSKSAFVNAAGYLASAAFILPIRGKEKRSPKLQESAGMILHEITEGIRELWKNHATRRVIGLLALLMGGAGTSVVAGTVLIQQGLGSVTKDLGILSLWMGVGILMGSLAYGRWGAPMPRRRILGISFLGCAAGLWAFVEAVMGLKSGVYASGATAFLGFWIAPVGIVANTLVHEEHSERLHGRIFSSQGVVVNLSLILSMLAAGCLGERVGRGVLLMAVGGVFALSGVFLLCYTKVAVNPTRFMDQKRRCV